MALQHLRLEIPVGHVAHVEINRPSKLNAFIPAMWIELGSVFTQLSRDPNVRVVVLSGAGDRAFSAGLDLLAAGKLLGLDDSQKDPSRRAVNLRHLISDMQACLTAIEACEKPVICVMHGIAFGLAVDIACCVDIRICSSDSRFSVKEVDIGLAADIGSLARLPKIVASASWVRSVCLTAREFSAEEALAVGFVSQVSPSKADAISTAIEMANLIASKSPIAVQGTKELLNHARDHSVADNLRYTSVWNSAAIQSSDVQKAFLSGMKKTKPTFEKL